MPCKSKGNQSGADRSGFFVRDRHDQYMQSVGFTVYVPTAQIKRVYLIGWNKTVCRQNESISIGTMVSQ